MVLESVDMFFQQGSSDKEYHIQINQQNDHLYNVEAQWGRRGGALNTQVKTITDNLTDARMVFNKIRGEKVGKGYRVQGGMSAQTGVMGTAPDFTTTPVEPIQEPAVAAPSPGRRRIMWRDDILPDPVTGPNALNGIYHEEQQPPLAQPVPDLGRQLPNGRVQTDIHPQLLNEIMDITELDTYLSSDEWAMQEKMDGKKIVIKWDCSLITITNKKGELIVSSPSFINAIRPCLSGNHNMLIDGEQIGDKFYVYDILEFNGDDIRNNTYARRYDYLKGLFSSFNTSGIIRVPLYMGTGKRGMFEEFKTQNKEGVVFKRLAAPFTAGKAHSDMWKWKFYSTVSARVAPGRTGKRSIGTELLNAPNGSWQFMGYCTIPPNKNIPEIGSIVEIRMLYCFRGGCFYQPTYLGVRDDVSAKECLLFQVKYKPE